MIGKKKKSRHSSLQPYQLENTVVNYMCSDFCLMFSVFPRGCQTFNGPHTGDCLFSIWKNTGCHEEGFANPALLNSLQNATLDALDIE